jgi:murein DD-endopeptidase MepM/ murein hydrolase activator NlpD
MRRYLARSVLLLVAASAGVLHWETRRLEADHASFTPLQVPPRYDAEAARAPGFVEDGVALDVAVALPKRLRSGETLGEVLVDQGLEPTQAEVAIRAEAQHVDLRKLKPGDRYAPTFDRERRLIAFDLQIEGRGSLALARAGESWASAWKPCVETRTVHTATGKLETSLLAAMRDAGAPPAVAYRMAEVLQWDVDFNRDLQPGDTFVAIYEEVQLDQRPHGIGDLRAVMLENGGRRLEAYRFGDGYYDAQGRPLAKLFLRSPLPFDRITSAFSHRRFHPVLKAYRPHYGVDYAAPVGTPVRATAAGTVVSAAWDGGGGRTVKLRHANNFLTAYLHLSRFASGVRPGKRVAQGDVIGYVGATGLATGPHLDYRVQQRGRWIDPTTLKGQPSEPIGAGQMASFLEQRDRLRQGLAIDSLIERDSGAVEIAGAAASAAALAVRN